MKTTTDLEHEEYVREKRGQLKEAVSKVRSGAESEIWMSADGLSPDASTIIVRRTPRGVVRVELGPDGQHYRQKYV